ncbi:MAG: 23S rRNA (guanosine2251-2'-O)-methyltransferase, partial [Parvicella sp.]
MYKNYNTRPAKESSDEFIYGIRAIIEAIEADRPINKIIIQQGLQGDLTKELREVLKGTEISYQIVP